MLWWLPLTVGSAGLVPHMGLKPPAPHGPVSTRSGGGGGGEGGDLCGGGVTGVEAARFHVFPMPPRDHSTARHAPRSACAGGGSGCPQPCASGDRARECQWSVGLTLSSAGRTFVEVE